MLEMGIIVAIGLLVTLAKLPWRWKLWFTSNPVIVDVSTFAVLTILHWGTFSGVMVATIGALFCSITLSAARWLVGYTKNGQYIAGKFDVSRKVTR
jgi:hypothetical protein